MDLKEFSPSRGSVHFVDFRNLHSLGDPSTLVDLKEFSPSLGDSSIFVDKNFHPLWVIRPFLWTYKNLGSKT